MAKSTTATRTSPIVVEDVAGAAEDLSESHRRKVARDDEEIEEAEEPHEGGLQDEDDDDIDCRTCL